MRSLFVTCLSAISLAASSSSLFAFEGDAVEEATEATAEQSSESEQTLIDQFMAELTPQTGAVEIAEAKARLEVPANFVFFAAADARRVLEEAWGNPPDESVLGMVMPAGATPFDDNAWAAFITYLPDGYVSDKDAEKIDYDKLLADLQRDARDANPWRTENGYDPIELVGWAEQPTYESESHKMYWAKELKFGEAETNTLNYDIRVLGRSGILVIEFVANMDMLPAIRDNAPEVLAMANFAPGATYADYRPGFDKKAAYGLAGLVAGAAIAKKTGLLAAILIFGKKFVVLILAGLAAAFGAVKRFLTGGGDR